MASWLKVAEDLFEVVDRRAKLVVSELADEQSDSQPSANGQEVQTRRTKTKDKGQLRHPGGEPLKPSNSEKEQNRAQISMPTVGSDIDEAPSSEKLVDIRDSSTEVTSADPLSETTKDTVISSIASSEVLHDGSREHDANNEMEATTTENTTEDVTSPGNGVASIEGSKVGLEEISSTPSIDQTDFVREDQPTNATPKDKLTIDNDSLKIDQDRHDTERVETDSTNNGKENDSGLLLEVSPELKKQQGLKTEMSPMRVQDQLDEAQGLLRSANSTGQSKEARLARVCAGLSSRLQEYKSENAQLEELLVAERELSHTYEARVKQLQQDLSVSKIEVARVESSMADALAAKNAELEALLSSMDALKKQASASEGKLASLQADMDAIMRSRELTETRVMQALREELASAERRAEEERMAHNATKMAAVEREVELEHRAVEASNALARNQRTADESTSRAMELGHKVALLEVECASLTQELQEMEARAKRGKKKSSEDANQILQMQAWQEEVERAHQGQRDAESKLSVLEAEVQKMRVEMSGMRRDAEHYSRQEHMELEKRYRELTDLLYHKQTQLEAMASEKSAAEFQLEKEARRLQEAQVEAERSRVSRRASSSWEEDTDLRALEPLPLHHRHMAGATMQLQRAAKLLDSGAVRATRFLWRYPTARVILLFYLVFVHLFLMYLLHRLQEQVDNFTSREVAASMGLGNSSLP